MSAPFRQPHRTPSGIRAGLILSLLINSILLSLVNVSFSLQLSFLALTALIVVTGHTLLKGIKLHFPDTISYVAASFFLGLSISYGLSFIVLHRGIRAALHLSPRAAVLGSFVLMAVYCGIAALKPGATRAPRLRSAVSPPALLVCVVAALTITAITNYGYYNNPDNIEISSDDWSFADGPMPNWGSHYDRSVHLHVLPREHFTEGFPPKQLNHFGTALVFLNYNLFVGDYDDHLIVASSKLLSFFFFFTTSYFSFLIARTIFGLTTGMSTVCAVAVLIFSPIVYPFIGAPPSPLGFFVGAAGSYQNAPQASQIACAICGVYLLQVAINEGVRTFFWGCALVVGSFFLKPTLFTLVAPCAFLLFFLHDEPFSRDRVAGYALLASVPVSWAVYIKVFGVAEMPLTLGWRFFETYLTRVQGRFPAFIENRSGWLIIAIVAFSFAAFIPAAVSATLRTWLAWRKRTCSLLAFLRQRRRVLFPAGLIMLAVISASILGGSGQNANYTWAPPAAYGVVFPLLVYSVCEIRNRYVRSVSWALFGAHLYFGAAYMLYFAYNSSLS